MEIVIALAIIGVGLIWYYNGKSKSAPASTKEDQNHLAPYKIETPEPAKCGCGRSPTGYCVGLHKLSEAEWASHPDNPKPVVEAKGDWPFPSPVAEAPVEKPKAKKAPAAKKPAAKKAPAAKPAAITAVKKPQVKKAKK